MTVLVPIKITSPFVKEGVKSPSGYQVVMCNPFQAAATSYQLEILRNVFNLNDRQIIDSIVESHSNKESVVFVGGREIAEMRTTQAERMRQQYISKSESLKKIGFVFYPL